MLVGVKLKQVGVVGLDGRRGIRSNVRVEKNVAVFEVLHVGSGLEVLLERVATVCGGCGDGGLVDAGGGHGWVHCGDLVGWYVLMEMGMVCTRGESGGRSRWSIDGCGLSERRITAAMVAQEMNERPFIDGGGEGQVMHAEESTGLAASPTGRCHRHLDDGRRTTRSLLTVRTGHSFPSLHS